MSNRGEIIHGFRIFISLPMDDVCTLKGLTPDMYVYQLKSRVELKAGIPGDIFNLVFMNVQLSEQQTLKSYHLKHGCIVRVQIESNWFGLFEACWRGDIYHVFENGVQFLDVEKLKGYNIDLWNKLVVHRATHALFIACHRGYLGLILELINRGATDINGKTIFGRTALHVAAYQGFVGCVSLLLSEGAICNQIDINGKTSLALAAENGHIYCEKRLLLYQWNLQSPFERSSRSSIAESEAERETKSASPRTTNERVVDSAGHDNNVRQGTKAFDFHLPRVSINTSVKQQMHLSKSADPARMGRHPFPLVQIAEKYKRELREYNERTGNFPRVQDDESTSETRYQKRTWDHNVETALAAKDTSKTLSSDEKKQNTNEPCDAETGISQKDLELMDEANKRNETVVQDMDSRDLALDTGVQDQENIRPSSGKMAVIRKLDIVMSAVDSSGHLKGGEKPNTDLERNGIDSEKKEGEMRIDFQDCSRKKPAQTFEHWIVMKRAQLRNRPCTAPAPNSKLGKSIDPESFKKWLNSKRLHRPNTSSESSAAPKKKFISSGGITYDHWLKTKTSKRPRSAVNHMPVGNSRDDITGAKDKMRRQILTGKSFELWLAEKKKGSQTLREGECNEDKYKHVSKRGKSFEVWLQDKRNQQQIELIQKMTAEKEDQKRKELEQFQKWFNPHYKSFDDWLAIKNQEVILNRVKAQNEPAKEPEIPAEEKEKDVKVVFDIWQTMKALKELSDEEKKYDEMKAKWAAKKREREQFQRLNTINKLKMRTTRQR